MSSDTQLTDAPRSAGHFALNLIALCAALAATWFSQRLWPGNPERSLLCGGGVAALVIAGTELLALKAGPRASLGLAAAPLQPSSVYSTVLRLLGLLVTLTAIGLVYWLLPEYHGRFYEPYWRFLKIIAWPMLLLAPWYLLWIGRRSDTSRDPYFQLGRLLLGRDWERIDQRVLRAHCLGWTVKAFFLPLMVVYIGQEIVAVSNAFHSLSWNTLSLYHFLYELAFYIDLLFCVLGYTLTLRLLDTHIRSTEPTAIGWIAALICYQPFYSLIGNRYLKYDDSGIMWDSWLAGFPLLRALWAAAIISLLLMYALSTVSFGLRFSNLTHRGIITSGPYRLTKHPAYLSKNLSWWLISVPFVSHSGWLEGIRHCALLGMLNLIYLLRARTEERHLSGDPVYVAYSEWIREHGLFARASLLRISCSPAIRRSAAGPRIPPPAR